MKPALVLHRLGDDLQIVESIPIGSLGHTVCFKQSELYRLYPSGRPQDGKPHIDLLLDTERCHGIPVARHSFCPDAGSGEIVRLDRHCKQKKFLDQARKRWGRLIIDWGGPGGHDDPTVPAILTIYHDDQIGFAYASVMAGVGTTYAAVLADFKFLRKSFLAAQRKQSPGACATVARSRAGTPNNAPLPIRRRFDIKRVRGGGGQGVVYEAFDRHLYRMVALKVVHLAEEARERALEATRAAARLEHPNIVRLYDAFAGEPGLWLVEELIDGRPLSSILQAAPQRRITPTQAVEITKSIAIALAAAHRQDVVHRDIRPENILIRSLDATPVLIDFGLARDLWARATSSDGEDSSRRGSGETHGDLDYLSPEQWNGKAATKASDIYSLGLVFYEMLSGFNPMADVSGQDEFARRAAALPPPLRWLGPDVTWMDGVCLRALHPDPRKRWPNPADLAEALTLPGREGNADNGASSPLSALWSTTSDSPLDQGLTQIDIALRSVRASCYEDLFRVKMSPGQVWSPSQRECTMYSDCAKQLSIRFREAWPPLDDEEGYATNPSPGWLFVLCSGALCFIAKRVSDAADRPRGSVPEGPYSFESLLCPGGAPDTLFVGIADYSWMDSISSPNLFRIGIQLLSLLQACYEDLWRTERKPGQVWTPSETECGMYDRAVNELRDRWGPGFPAPPVPRCPDSGRGVGASALFELSKGALELIRLRALPAP